MSQIQRISISNPAADTDTLMFESNGLYVVSVIVSNKDDILPTSVDIWIAPEDTSTESEWGYIVKNASIDVGNTMETFRFSLLNNDALYIRSDNGNASFTLVGINQS